MAFQVVTEEPRRERELKLEPELEQERDCCVCLPMLDQ